MCNHLWNFTELDFPLERVTERKKLIAYLIVCFLLHVDFQMLLERDLLENNHR